MPPHHFVLARLLPQNSATWTSVHGPQQAAALVTRPFLALRIFAHDVDCGAGFESTQFPLLFVISPEKPSGGNENTYFALGSTPAERTLVVKPPIPCNGRTLYVHTSPRLLQQPSVKGDNSKVLHFGPHQLDPSSLLAFYDAVRSHNRSPESQALPPPTASSGGKDVVEANWDTWSGRTETGTEHLHIQQGCFYELLEFKNLPVNEAPTIYEELKSFWQLARDYSWSGVTWTVAWAQHALKYLSEQKALSGLPLNDQYDDQANAILQPDTDKLASLRVPIDGNPVPPPPPPSAEDEMVWEEDPCPDFNMAPVIQKQITAQDVKVIAFDLYGTLLDRETGIREAVSALFPFKKHQITSDNLLKLYIEFEGLRLHQNHPSHSSMALEDVARHLCVQITKGDVDVAVERISRSKLYDGIVAYLASLHAHGYTLVALPSPHNSFVVLKSQLPDCVSLHFAEKASRTDFDELLTYCRSIFPDLNKEQVLVVTSLSHHAEPAAEAGFPTALIKHAGRLGSDVHLNTMNPTYVSSDLQSLVGHFIVSSSPPSSPAATEIDDMVRGRLFQSYELTYSLGMGSFGTVFNGFHVVTGNNVAVKIEVPEGEPNDNIVLPYEAAIYKQLSGIHGVSRLHWYGVEGTTHIMVIDKLGANLQQLRRLCRGHLSLRTVLLLAEQILTRVEAVHSRGIIVRDIKPENFAMGLKDDCNLVHLLDFGIAKLYRDPATGKHIPYREGRDGYGTPRYASYRIHFGQEQSRRDDMESVGNVLLYLLHGSLPWQGIYAPSIPAKILRIGEMKSGEVFQDIIASSPAEFKAYFEHIRALGFEDKPDYVYLRRLFRERMTKEGWTYEDWKFDWIDTSLLQKGTIIPGQYKLDAKYAEERELGW